MGKERRREGAARGRRERRRKGMEGGRRGKETKGRETVGRREGEEGKKQGGNLFLERKERGREKEGEGGWKEKGGWCKRR